MKRILIICGAYYPQPLANGLCVDEIAQELKKRNWEVHILCFEQDSKEDKAERDGILIHRVKPRFFFYIQTYGEKHSSSWKGKIALLLAKIMHIGKRILFIPFFPLLSFGSANRYKKCADKLFEKYHFETVISVYHPAESLYAGNALKKKYQFRYILYVLDTLTHVGYQNKLINWYSQKRGLVWEKKSYKKADLIINMKCYQKYYESSIYDQYRSKIVFSDIPYSIQNWNSKKSDYFNDNSLHFIYTGSLSFAERDPEVIIKAFYQLNQEGKPYHLDFFSRGDCESLLAKHHGSFLTQHGFVPAEEADCALQGADVIISIGAKNYNMIPSKIFKYISTGKKIIHFYTNENDVCFPYFDQYPNVEYISLTESHEKIVELVKSFAEKKLETVSEAKRRQILQMNFPSYTVDLMEKGE